MPIRNDNGSYVDPAGDFPQKASAGTVPLFIKLFQHLQDVIRKAVPAFCLQLMVIMCHICRNPCMLPRFFRRIIQPARRRYTHCRSVSVTAIRLRLVSTKQPVKESSAITGIRITMPPVLHGGDQLILHLFIRFFFCIHQCFRNGDRHNCVISKTCFLCEQGNTFVLFPRSNSYGEPIISPKIVPYI